MGRIKGEHRELGKDLMNVLVSYTPLSGILDTIKFIHKWFVKRRAIHRFAGYTKSSLKRLKRKNIYKNKLK